MITYPYRSTAQDFAGYSGRYDRDQLLGWFRSMLRIRRIEEAIEARYSEDQMKTPIHLVIGQEATSVGCCAALTPQDLVYSSHRTHGHYLAKGGDLKRMLSEMFCRADGCAGSRGGSMHLIDKAVGMAGTSAIVGGAVPVAAGAALAAQLCGASYVTVVFLGDATAEEGVASETLNFASLKRLPIVFFCENNFYSVQSPLAKRQPPQREIHRWAATYGMPACVVDGTNVLAVYETAREAVRRARAGQGPTFIESPVYRFRAHGGAGDDSATGYRQVAEREAWEAVCPLVRFGAFLRGEGCLTDTLQDAMEREIAAEIAEAFAHAERSPNPTAADLYRHVYAD